MKSLVAIFAALLVLVGPAAAQDPSGEPEPSGEPSGEPGAQDPSAEPQPEPSGEPADPASQGNGTSSSSSQASMGLTCPLVESRIGDPGAKIYQWVNVDPRGCFQQLVYRVVGSLPPYVTRHL